VLDEWFSGQIQLLLKGKSFIVRWADDFILVFAYNLSVMMRQKKSKFRRQEYWTFIDWFISVLAKISRSGH
jgi:hypothetical protein